MTAQAQGHAARSHMHDASKPRDVSGLPPAQDIDAETAVVASVLVHGDAVERVIDLVDSEDFHAIDLRWIMIAVFALVAEGTPVEVVTVSRWLRSNGKLDLVGGAVRLAALMDETPACVHLEVAAKRVRDVARVRRMAEAAQRIAAEAYGKIDDPQTWLDRTEARVTELARAESTSSLVSLRDALGEVFSQAAAEADSGGHSGIKTGFRGLDDMLGGLYPGEQTVIAGRPGMGKTAFAMEVAMNAAGARVRGGAPSSVLVFSLEMPRAQLTARTVCTAARVHIKRLRSGHCTPSDWNALTVAAARIADLPVYFDDRPGLSPLEIRAKARRVQRDEERAGRRLGVIVVDYLQLCRARQFVASNASREQEVSFVSQALKDLAKELEVPVVVLAQLNRDVAKAKDKRPGLTDLRESGAVEQNADAVIFVHREDYYLGDKTPVDQRGAAELIVAKSRMGESGTTRAYYYAGCGLFTDQAPC